jgi:hypothetical protein
MKTCCLRECRLLWKPRWSWKKSAKDWLLWNVTERRLWYTLRLSPLEMQLVCGQSCYLASLMSDVNSHLSLGDGPYSPPLLWRWPLFSTFAWETAPVSSGFESQDWSWCLFIIAYLYGHTCCATLQYFRSRRQHGYTYCWSVTTSENLMTLITVCMVDLSSLRWKRHWSQGFVFESFV